MNPTPKENAIILLASALMMGEVFHKPLGLSDLVGDFMMFGGFVCMFAFSRLRRRTKLQAGAAPPDPSDKPVRKKRVWLIVLSAGLASATFPFIARYEGLFLPFTELVMIAIFTFVLSVSIAIYSANRAP